MKPRILYLATADARGHLMRAQLLSRALIERGAEVRVLTTSDEGATFLGEFGIACWQLSAKGHPERTGDGNAVAK